MIRVAGFRIGTVRRVAAFVGGLVLFVPAPAAMAAAPTLSISDVTVTEPNHDQGSFAVLEVTLSRAIAQQVTVKFATHDLAATEPEDYQALTGTVTFPAHTTSKIVAVGVWGDNLDEPNERFSVSLTNPTNATIADGIGYATLTDNDPAPVVWVNDTSVVEPNGSSTAVLAHNVRLTIPSGRTVTVKVATANGTATGNVDYTPIPVTTLTFAPGQTVKSVPLTVRGDGIAEADETVKVSLSAPTNATIAGGAPGVGVGTILDNDGP